MYQSRNGRNQATPPVILVLILAHAAGNGYLIYLVKGMTTMNNLSHYIDRCLIDEHAVKDFRYGYSLEVGDIPHYELQSFLDKLIENDEQTRELIRDRMQELINSRLQIVESKQKYNAGFVPVLDNVSGEVNWLPSIN